LGYAKRSAGEVRAHLYDALEEGYLSKKEFDELCERTKKICRMIAGLIHYLQTLDHSQKRTRKLTTNNQ
jgi:four helix bundle protein